jgi:hypothetical protein
MRQILHNELCDFVRHYILNVDDSWYQQFEQPDLPLVTELDVRLGTIVYYENNRKKADPQHEAHPDTWTKLWAQYQLSKN